MHQQRYVLLSFVLGAILVGWTFQAASVSLMAQFAYPDTRLGGLLPISTVLGVATAAISFFALLRNRKAVRFTDEVIVELARTTWPTREETVKASTTVVFTTLFVAALLGAYDVVWRALSKLILYS